MSDLSPAYEDALKQITKKHGQEMAAVVKNVITMKLMLSQFETLIDDLDISDKQRAALIELVVERISDDVSTMCVLMRKGFKDEVLPIVEEVTRNATNLKNLQ